MPLVAGAGSNDPPTRVPIAEVASQFGAAVQQYGQNEKMQALDGLEWRISPPWSRFFSEIARILADLTAAPATATTYGVALTPAATVTPQLERAAENGVFGILLDRATTTIAAATLDGAYPPDYYRFTILLVNDATDGRLKVWDAAYLGVSADDGSGAPDAINIFSFITLPSGAGFVLSGPYSTVEA